MAGDFAELLTDSNRPQIIVTDLYMPNMDGLETIIDLREHFPEVRIIAISGGLSRLHILNVAGVLGADDILIKPFQPAELLEAIRRLAE